MKTSKVSSVQLTGDVAPVYDLTVDGTASFFANGILVHNTKDPSVNQWPWEVRSSIIPVEGKKFVFFDWSGAELYLAAKWAKCEPLTSRYEAGEDLHRFIASKILGREITTNEEREISKVVSFATIYGSEGDSVARALRIDRGKGVFYVQKFLAEFPEIATLRAKIIAYAKKTGYTKTRLGRYRKLPGIHSSNNREVDKAARQSFNTAIQGGVADFMKLGVI